MLEVPPMARLKATRLESGDQTGSVALPDDSNVKREITPRVTSCSQRFPVVGSWLMPIAICFSSGERAPEFVVAGLVAAPSSLPIGPSKQIDDHRRRCRIDRPIRRS